VVEVNVRARDDVGQCAMLDLGQRLSNAGPVVIVEKSDHTRNLIARLPFLLDELAPNGVTDRFRAVLVVAGTNKSIKSGKKLPFDRHTETNQFSHLSNTSSNFVTPRLRISPHRILVKR